MYYGLWSCILRREVWRLEEMDPSRVETKHGFTGQVTVVENEHWSQEEMMDQLLRYMSHKTMKRTANLLDLMAGQRMGLNPFELKDFICELRCRMRKAYPEVELQTTKKAIFLTRP